MPEQFHDLTLQECRERWGISSANTIKARAQKLGVQLRRESPTRTVWPAEAVALGDALHRGQSLEFITGQTIDVTPLQEAPGAAAGTITAAEPSAVATQAPPAFMEFLKLLQGQLQAQPPAALQRARTMAAAADEQLHLTSPELAQIAGLEASEMQAVRNGTVLYGFRLERHGKSPRPSKATGERLDRRTWTLHRDLPADG